MRNRFFASLRLFKSIKRSRKESEWTWIAAHYIHCYYFRFTSLLAFSLWYCNLRIYLWFDFFSVRFVFTFLKSHAKRSKSKTLLRDVAFYLAAMICNREVQAFVSLSLQQMQSIIRVFYLSLVQCSLKAPDEASDFDSKPRLIWSLIIDFSFYLALCNVYVPESREKRK